MSIPRKRFGQHFLRNQNMIRRIIAALDPKPNDHLIEIGPGEGALTLPLLKAVHQLEVIELDRDLIPLLEERSQGIGHLTIYSADALTFDFGALKKDRKSLRLFGNLPYNISTPLIFHLLTFSPLIEDMVFMLQKEVGMRLAASPNDDDYGRLSVMVQYHFKVELLFNVPPDAFHPRPQVQSAIVHLIPYQTLPHKAKDYGLFANIVKHAFGKRRKTLRNSLKGIVNDNVWAHIPIHSNLRAENLTVQDFVEISNACLLTP